jgi:superfamily II DNA or RNA helicase
MNLNNFNLSNAQNELLNNLLNNFESEGRTIVETLTGTGKTRVVIEALKKLAFKKVLKLFLVVVQKRLMTINSWKKN